MSETMDWLRVPAATIDEQARAAAAARQNVLTKPAGSLGRLEDIAITLAGLQGSDRPRVDKVHITVFAGDHGVAAEGISAFPQAVTAAMVKNFIGGGAAISVLARSLDACLEVINLGTVEETGPIDKVKDYNLGPGTQNFVKEAAMNEHQLARALHAGRHAVERARLAGADLFIGGEMGIGNTTAATAVACAMLDQVPEQIAGPGTGLDSKGVAHKAAVIRQALNLHLHQIATPLDALRRLGGFEIAALAGSYLACAQIGLPALVDGFIATGAALAAVRLNPAIAPWLLYSHASAEPGHRAMLAELQAQPLLNLGMRLGEGSGAAVTVPLLRLACALHNNMATFADAGVQEKIS